MEIRAERFGAHPLIVPDMDHRTGENICGPSLIRVPDWVTAPLGRYYLYFAHHDGGYLRLAYADKIVGPWTIHEPGILQLDCSGFEGHIASPDVSVDDAARCIRLYFHGSDLPSESWGPQSTSLATSPNGLDFQVLRSDLAKPYFRVFSHRDWYYGIAMPGVFYRSAEGTSEFEEGHNPFEPGMRHAAALVRNETLWIFYSRVGDRPEHIMAASIDLSHDWYDWSPGNPISVLRPEYEYEGADLALQSSVAGMAKTRVRELRDPAIFVEDGDTFLLYCIAGESGIAAAKLYFEDPTTI